jgi:hypothetical protein
VERETSRLFLETPKKGRLSSSGKPGAPLAT